LFIVIVANRYGITARAENPRRKEQFRSVNRRSGI
jgi:hypothetical protein